MFVFALAFVLIAMAFFFRHSVVDGSSMANTLLDGEHLIISDLFYIPKTGDIVVVQDVSKAEEDRDLRLTAGERVKLIAELEKQMREASKMLEFEYAALLRDRIIKLRGGVKMSGESAPTKDVTSKNRKKSPARTKFGAGTRGE